MLTILKLHQVLPPILSILLHSSLAPSHAIHLRTAAAQTLSRLLTQHSTTYPSLAPRIMKTLLLALVAPGKGKGTREGAVRGLMGVGKEAIRKGLVEGGGARVIGSECSGPNANRLDSRALAQCVVVSTLALVVCAVIISGPRMLFPCYTHLLTCQKISTSRTKPTSGCETDYTKHSVTSSQPRSLATRPGLEASLVYLEINHRSFHFLIDR